MVHFTEKLSSKELIFSVDNWFQTEDIVIIQNKDTFKVTINFPIKQPRNGQSGQQSGGELKNSMTREDATRMQNNMAATELIKKK